MVNQKDIHVGIYIPTFNRGKYIKQTVKTLLNQTHKNICITVVDNASVDDTEEIVRSIIDSRINYIKNEINIGAINNFNKCIDISLANNDQFMCIFHSEDLYSKEIVEKELRLILKSDDIGVVFSNLRFVDENNNDLPRVFEKRYDTDIILSEQDLIETTLAYGTPLVCPTFMARTIIFKAIGYFDNRYVYAGDTDFYFRVSKVFRIGIINEVLIKYRVSSTQESFKELTNRKDISEEFVLLNSIKNEYANTIDKNTLCAYNQRLSKEYLCLVQLALLKDWRREKIVEYSNRSIEFYKFPYFSKLGLRQMLLKFGWYSLYKFLYKYFTGGYK